MGANKRLFEQEREISNNYYKNKKKMARGSENDDSNKTVFFVKIRGLKKEHVGDPWIGFDQKQGEDYVEVSKGKWVSGWLASAKTGVYQYEGKDVKKFELVLEDGIEKYIFQSTYNSLSRSVINSLLSTTKYGILKISVYTNKNGYKSIGIEMDGEKIKWKYTMDEFKAKTDPVKNKKGEVIQIDYSELDAFLEEEIKNHIAPNCKPNPNPYVVSQSKDESVKSELEVKPLTGKAKIDKANELKAELDEKSGANSFIEGQDDILPF